MSNIIIERDKKNLKMSVKEERSPQTRSPSCQDRISSMEEDDLIIEATRV
jgi:hypothetical protein